MTATLAGKDTAIFERGGFVYFVSTLGPFDPAESEIDEFSFGSDLKAMAPNPHLLWLHGTYVEAGHPVDHGSHQLEWSAEDLAIKSLTPVFCPVTVMHDPSTAVGLIADTKLIPGTTEGPTRIDNTLAVWAHRFPETAAEVMSNHQRGTLMQSQECRPAYWECGDCGQRFLDKPLITDHQASEHSALNRKPTRKLGNVTFTGTGLIFGSRGIRGALSTAHLDVLADEVSEFHERSRTDKPARTTRRTRKVDIDQKEYEALVARASKVDDLQRRLDTAEEASARVPDLERKLEQLEVDNKKATDDLATEKSAREQLEEQSRATTLAEERLSKVGSGFKAKLPDSIRERLSAQAKTMSDDDWSARLDELSSLVETPVDDKGDGKAGESSGKSGSGSEEFSREQISRSGAGASGASSATGEPSRAATEQVMGGLLGRLGPKAKEPASAGKS